MGKIAVIALAVILIITFVIHNKSVEASAGYRKPPFNGSIFGKRNSGNPSQFFTSNNNCYKFLKNIQLFYPFLKKCSKICHRDI